MVFSPFRLPGLYRGFSCIPFACQILIYDTSIEGVMYGMSRIVRFLYIIVGFGLGNGWMVRRE